MIAGLQSPELLNSFKNLLAQHCLIFAGPAAASLNCCCSAASILFPFSFCIVLQPNHTNARVLEAMATRQTGQADMRSLHALHTHTSTHHSSTKSWASTCAALFLPAMQGVQR